MADDKKFYKKLDVRGEIDTAMPIADRPHGTLVVATDLDSKSWGPRRGSQRFTGVWEGPGTASLYDEITFPGTGSNYAIGAVAGDLGTAFTLDLWARVTDVSGVTGTNAMGLYQFYVGGIGILDVSLRGPNHADHERVHVEITTSASRSSSDARVAFTGATRLSVGSTQMDKHHLRFVRDGATLTLYLDGVADGSTSSLAATHGLNSTLGQSAAVTLGTSFAHADNGSTLLTVVPWKGQIFGAWLRDGAFSTQPIEARMPCAPRARNVRHAYLGRKHALGDSTGYVYDASRYGAHAKFQDTGWSASGAVDNAAPAPAPVQGIRSWQTRANRTASSVLVGGQLSTAVVS